MQLTQPCISIILVTLLPLFVVGCTTNKVSGVYSHAGGGVPVGPGVIRSFASFNDLKERYQIRGMLCAMVLPLMNNTPEARETVVRGTAAGLGADSLVGLTSLVDPYADYSKSAHSCAILVNTGVQLGEKQSVRPKFIVCIPPVMVKTGKVKDASRLEPYITQELQFHLARKGYYVYLGGSKQVDVTGLATTKEIPAELREPLGVTPDFVLTCEIVEGSSIGLQTLELGVTLYDVQQARTVLQDVTELVGWGLLEQLTSPEKKWFLNEGDARKAVHQAVEVAIKKLSPVSGYGNLKK